jgi:hypothetical protein
MLPWYSCAMKTKYMIIIACMAIITSSSCRRTETISGELVKTSSITNGTEVLLFPEWTNSPSAFERFHSTNLYAVYYDGKWTTKYRIEDGTLKQFWTAEMKHDDIQGARQTFGMNIDWNIKKGIHDAFSK